jgi:predicted transcriptional regulator
MAIYTKRVQAVLTEEQYAKLAELAQSTGKPISVLVREAVEATYLERRTRQRRMAALDELLSLDAPVGEWPEMEQEIVNGATSS